MVFTLFILVESVFFVGKFQSVFWGKKTQISTFPSTFFHSRRHDILNMNCKFTNVSFLKPWSDYFWKVGEKSDFSPTFFKYWFSASF